jgi:cellulose synthase/poly-beta-1,6-N-acetylglucosamine synthase-like glycosyltransferase
MNAVLSMLFALPPLLLFYTWCAYPLLVLGPARRRRQPQAVTGEMPPGETPALMVILSAFNEAGVIAARIRNLRDVEYPAGQLTVLIGTDGCTDATARIAREAAAPAPHIRIIEREVNRGKVAMLRDLVAQAATLRGDTPSLLVFTDANTAFRPDALRRLARHFSDPRIGGVCGRLVFKGAGSGEERAYWNLETMLKEQESALDSCLGANGAIYAIRPECFWKDIPVNTIVDDFVIGMKVREAGFRMLYDPLAVAEEDIPDIRDEWCRRIRIGSGDYQAARLCKACLHPRFGVFAWCFWSHKILRWFTPHLLLLMLASVLATAAGSVFRTPPLPVAVMAAAIGLGSALLLTAAVAGRLSRRRTATAGTLLRLCRGADHFVTMQAALLAGFLRFCRGNLSGAWTRTPRAAS